MSTDLLVLEAPSIPTGFRFLNSLTNVKLIDAEPIGAGRFLVVALGSAASMKEAVSSVKDASFELIEACDQTVLDAIYSLASNKLGESLLVLDCETAPALVALAQTFVREHSLRAVEIKIRKTGMGGGYAYFTGDRSRCEAAGVQARAWLTQKMQKGQVEVIDRPSEITRSLFED